MQQLSSYVGTASKCNAGRGDYGRYPGSSRLICHLARIEGVCKVCYRGIDQTSEEKVKERQEPIALQQVGAQIAV